MKTYATLDSAGIGLSALCVIHCLFLPIIGSSLPLMGVVSESEWVHKALVLLTLPIVFSLIASTNRVLVQSMAALGAALLCAAVMIPQLHDFETTVTVFGALLLGLAHTLRLMKQSHSH